MGKTFDRHVYLSHIATRHDSVHLYRYDYDKNSTYFSYIMSYSYR